MEVFTPKEVAEQLGISVRAVQKRCSKYKVKRKNNQYQISAELLQNWKDELEDKRTEDEPVRELNEQVRELKEKVRLLNEDLTNSNAKFQIKELSVKGLKNKLADEQEKVKFLNEDVKKLTELLKIKDNEISGLKDELKQYNVKPNERIEVFTNEEYQLFEQRLREWYSLQKDIEHKDELFNSEKKSLSELVEHYKNQFEYQKEQSTRILDMHQKLIDTIEKQNIITLQRNAIEAIEKEVIYKENWKTKK